MPFCRYSTLPLVYNQVIAICCRMDTNKKHLYSLPGIHFTGSLFSRDKLRDIEMPDHEFTVQRLSRIWDLLLGSRVLLHIAAYCFAFLTDWGYFDAGAGMSFFRQNYFSEASPFGLCVQGSILEAFDAAGLFSCGGDSFDFLIRDTDILHAYSYLQVSCSGRSLEY